MYDPKPMDKLTTYRQALSNIIQEHGQHQPSHDQIQTLTEFAIA